MKLILSEAGLARVEIPLQALGLDLEPMVVSTDGAIHANGQAVAEDAIRPEVMWMSLDLFVNRGLGPFFRVALSSPSLKWLQTFNAGLDSPLFKQIFDRGVRISNSNAQAPAISEYILAQVLAEWHPVKAQRAAQATHEWSRIGFRELSQSRWLIVGYGNIGRETAKRAKAFGAHVIGIRRSPGADDVADAIAPMSALPSLLPDADVVVLTAPLTEATHHLADARFFAAMKDGAYLVNVGRGGLVDEAALLAALDTNRPGLAILDVFETEPLPKDSPFWDHPLVRMTAHCSPASTGTFLRGDQLFLDNLARYARGGTLITEVTERTFA
ncbi:MAG: D-2-hydroxyacid dehydrogenase [Rhizomicrobium sp.]|jgi:phosphoglycerate dehydrogenase-like enzyme